jgi:hypothetical protein
MAVEFNAKCMSRKPIPFPFIEEVKRESVNLLSRHDGINIWTVPLHHQIGFCAPNRGPALHTLWGRKVDQCNMAAVPIDSPERSTDAPKKTTVLEFYNASRHVNVRVTPERFLDEFALNQPPSREFRTFPYLTDIDCHDAWEKDTAHYLNTVLLSHSPFNLCTLMTEKRDFPGFLSASWYCKASHSYFRAHVEQLFAPSMNVCYAGGTTWWCIKRADVAKYEKFFIEFVKDELNMKNEGVGEWPEEQSRLLLALLYAKKTFIDPRLLAAAGIEVFQLSQKAGDVVMLDGDIVHLGVCNEKWSINEAINFLPVTWLRSGLPLLSEWLKWLEGYIHADLKGAYHTQHPQLHQAIFNDRVKMLVGKHCPRKFTVLFLETVKESVRQEVSRRLSAEGGGEEQRDHGTSSKRRKTQRSQRTSLSARAEQLSSIDYNELRDEQLLAAISHIDSVVIFLNRQEVISWYGSCCPGDS